MRSLIFAAAAATTLGIAGPASAQTVYVDDGYRGGPGVEFYVGAPRARLYDEAAPRYRSRSYDRWSGDAYAYDSAPRYRYRRDWDDGYRTNGRW
jgi:hypothetical protein